MRYVYVLDMDGKPLMPTCRFGKVRRMLRSGQAKAVDTLPFTIQLTYKPKTRILQPVTIGLLTRVLFHYGKDVASKTDGIWYC